MIKIYNRLKKLEQRLSPSDDGTFTLEQLCRAMWRDDKRKFLKIAEGTNYTLFVRRFESEDLESERQANRSRREYLPIVKSILSGVPTCNR